MPKTCKAPLHYIWVGGVPDRSHLGHDTIGPDLMREKYPKHPIFFWCLKEELPRYQAYFDKRHEGRDKIVVCAIEAYASCHLPELADFIALLLKTLPTHKVYIDKVRELVTIKALFQYFLQLSEWGYFLDTNITPNPDESGEIPRFDTFIVPRIHNEGKKPTPDPWLMYSPGASAYSKVRFFTYFSRVKDEFERRGEDKSVINRQILAHAFVRSVMDNGGCQYHEIKRTSDSMRIWAFQKRYYNTHKEVGDCSNAHYVLLDSNTTKEFEYFIRFGEMKTDEVYELDGRITSLIHLAIELDKPFELALCLKAARNSRVKLSMASVGGKTPFSYALERVLFRGKSTRCLSVILDHEWRKKGFESEVDFVSTVMRLFEEKQREKGKFFTKALMAVAPKDIDGLISLLSDFCFSGLESICNQCFESDPPLLKNSLDTKKLKSFTSDKPIPRFFSKSEDPDKAKNEESCSTLSLQESA